MILYCKHPKVVWVNMPGLCVYVEAKGRKQRKLEFKNREALRRFLKYVRDSQ